MRAVLVKEWGAPETASVQDVADPAPGDGEVLVAPAAIGVNYPDLLVVEGKYQFRPPAPFTPGKEAAGTVVAAGDGVDMFETGDRVMVQVEYGAYAELVKARQDECFRLPDSVPFDAAAAMGLVYQTSWFALRERANVQPGEWVLVNGAAGGIGIAALQLARAMGARAIAGIGQDVDKDVLRDAGAEAIVRLDRVDLRDALREDVRRITDGHGADVVIDPVGGASFEAALRALAWRGRLVVIGFASGDIPTVKANYLLVKNIAVSGLQWSDYRDRTPALMQEAQAEIFRFHEEGIVKPHVMERLPLDDFAIALAKLGRREVTGKLVLVPRGA